MGIDQTLFASNADLKLRLDNTIIRYKGKPFHCRASGGDDKLSLTRLDDKETQAINVPADHPDLDISSPPLGFVNYDRTCVYYSRLPQRKYKQGLSQDGIQVRSLYGTSERNREHPVNSTRLSNTIRGIYTSFHSCFTRATSTSKDYAQAFSRNFALAKVGATGDIHLYHKFTIIGDFDRKKRYFCLKETYNNEYTRRLLRKHGVPLNELEF